MEGACLQITCMLDARIIWNYEPNTLGSGVCAYRSSRLFVRLRPGRRTRIRVGSTSVQVSSERVLSKFKRKNAHCFWCVDKSAKASRDLGMLQACIDKNYFEHGWRVKKFDNLRTMSEQMVLTVCLSCYYWERTYRSSGCGIPRKWQMMQPSHTQLAACALSHCFGAF